MINATFFGYQKHFSISYRKCNKNQKCISSAYTFGEIKILVCTYHQCQVIPMVRNGTNLLYLREVPVQLRIKQIFYFICVTLKEIFFKLEKTIFLTYYNLTLRLPPIFLRYYYYYLLLKFKKKKVRS